MFEEACGVATDLEHRIIQVQDDILDLQEKFKRLISYSNFNDSYNTIKMLAKVKTDAGSLNVQMSVIQNEMAYISNIDVVNRMAGFDPVQIRQIVVAATITTNTLLEDVNKYIHNLELKLGLIKE